MPDRRHAANRKSGRFPDEVGVGAADPLADERGDPLFIDTVGARSDDENGRPDLARKTSDFAICATVQPIAAAASSEVRVLASNSSTANRSPSAACTLSAEGAVAGFMAGPRKD